MNAYRKLLRVWITVTSFVGLVAGWIFLSRTSDTNNVVYIGNTAIEMPAWQAIPTVESVNPNSALNSLQTFTVNPSTSQSQSFFSPPMRTGGS